MSESERIGIREAARRLGVSDTAVHKALKSGRVSYAEPHDPARPKVLWPDIRAQWHANTDGTYRSHVGPKKERQEVAAPKREPRKAPEPACADPPPSAPPPAPPRMPTSAEGASVSADPSGQPNPAGVSYARSRAIREAYQAQLAKLEFEERSGRLVSVEAVKIEAFKTHRRVRDAILNIPDRCAPQLATMTDAVEIHAYLLSEITQALRQLSSDIYAPAN